MWFRVRPSHTADALQGSIICSRVAPERQPALCGLLGLSVPPVPGVQRSCDLGGEAGENATFREQHCYRKSGYSSGTPTCRVPVPKREFGHVLLRRLGETVYSLTIIKQRKTTEEDGIQLQCADMNKETYEYAVTMYGELNDSYFYVLS